MTTRLFKQFIKDAEVKFSNDADVLAVLEELEAETNKDSRILGTLLTTALCWDGKL